MIIDTGNRTDVPAFYSEWYMKRIREGYVMVRNPYSPEQVTRYRLDPEVVDALVFCSKNPGPMIKYLDELDRFRMFWYVTITPYGKSIEPNVPDKHKVIEDFKRISEHVGKHAMSWRYDPIFISVDANGKTTASLPISFKETYSHRAKATAQLLEYLRTKTTAV